MIIFENYSTWFKISNNGPVFEYSHSTVTYIDCVDGIVLLWHDEMYSDGGFAMPEDMEAVGEQEGGGWDVDEELELPPDLVSG